MGRAEKEKNLEILGKIIVTIASLKYATIFLGNKKTCLAGQIWQINIDISHIMIPHFT